MATIEDGKPKHEMVETIYSLIRDRSGRITTKDLYKKIGDKKSVKLAIITLYKERKIKRIKGFGADRIEYFYQDALSTRQIR